MGGGLRLHGPAGLAGSLRIPGSKSHTIRALLMGALAEGVSEIHHPLDADDTRSALALVRQLGAKVLESVDCWTVEGAPWRKLAHPQRMCIDVGNSGTSLYLASAVAGLFQIPVSFQGDASIRKRTAEPLLLALEQLGAKVHCQRAWGYAPYTITGPLRAGKVELSAPTSQYLSALLLACPLIEGEPGATVIQLRELNERPYVRMTLSWLERQGIRLEYERDYSWFSIPNNQHYRALSSSIPADYSSATFFLCAAALSQSHLRLECLAPDPTQGDSRIVEMLQAMGANISRVGDVLEVRPAVLVGAELNLNDTPDALPALAVTACFAGGTTRLFGVEQARIKETNRIEVMAMELSKLGAEVSVQQDGLTIEGRTPLHPNFVSGHHDHRVVMALAIASLGISGGLTIDDVSAASVTFPGFFDLLARLKERFHAG